ncbi:MAG: PEP-CTERM sorting domain-containing protein [Burkholderiaceae bacterium]
MNIARLTTVLSAAVLTSIAGTAIAAPVNLITNGSFESGLSGWTQTGFPTTYTPTTTPIAAITYGSNAAYPVGAFGEAVPVPNDASQSPDAAGMHGAYFVDDNAVNEGLSQSIFLAAGSYRVGFDAYAPFNGYSNPNDATFAAQIAGATLASYAVSSTTAGVWTAFTGLANIVTPGFYSASFVFNSFGTTAKDVVIDRVYVIASTDTGGQSIPEPSTIALLGLAVAGLVAARRRK